MSVIRLVFASEYFFNSSKIQQVLRSTGAPLRSLSDIVEAEKRGHLPLREVLSAERLIGFGILAAEEALIVITSDDEVHHMDLLVEHPQFPIARLGATIVVVPKQDRNNPEAIAALLAPYGDFKLPESAAA